MKVVTTTTGRKYHRIEDKEAEHGEDVVSCSNFISKEIEILDKEKAEEKGYDPCRSPFCFGDDHQ